MKTGLASFTAGDFLIAASCPSNNPLPPSSSRVCTEPTEASAQAVTLTNAWFWSPEVVGIYHTHIKIKHNIREALIKPYQTQTWQDYDLSIKLPEELWFNILVHNPLFVSLYRTEKKKKKNWNVFPPPPPSSVLFYLLTRAGKSVSASPMKKGDINCSESWKRRKPCKQVTCSHSLSPNSRERNMSTPCRGCNFLSFRSKSEDCSVPKFLRFLWNISYCPKLPEYSTKLAGIVVGS